MKITYRDIEMKLESAVEHAATPDPYSYDGQLEKLQAQNEKLRELVARLCVVIFDDETSGKKCDQLAYVLGCRYEVEE